MKISLNLDILKEEKENILKSFGLVCDTREKVNNHIKDYFVKNNIKFIDKALSIGDYSLYLPNSNYWIGEPTFEKRIVIERKNSLDELANNFTQDRDRFENEFLRALKEDTKIVILIENCTLEDLYKGNYNSKINPKAFRASLYSFCHRYDIEVVFCPNKENTGKFIHEYFYYYLNEKLK